MVVPLVLALLPFLLFIIAVALFGYYYARWRAKRSVDLTEGSFWSEFSMPVRGRPDQWYHNLTHDHTTL